MRLSTHLLPIAGALTSLGAYPASPPPILNVTVQNRLALDRRAETISIPVTQLAALLRAAGSNGILVKNVQSGRTLASQLLDANGDGRSDALLFQTDIKAGGTQKFTLQVSPGGLARQKQKKDALTTYSRFVPERTDDYAWENDRVAFRTYGPEAERLVVARQPGGTLTSGMDCWLKRVPYPVIDKWYAANVKEIGYYHKDHGEGYDPYHVGDSRGFAGVGVWDKDSLYISRNFISYKKLANGPIRTLFELTYAPWPAGGRVVTEKKLISLDLGSNLSRFEDHVTADRPLPNLTIGTTLHAEPSGVRGEVKGEPQQGWFRYWEPLDDAYLGTGIVLPPGEVQKWVDRRTKAKEQSHLLIVATPKANVLTYYAGFGWTKSGQFKSAVEWDTYLADFAQRLASPLIVTLSNR